MLMTPLYPRMFVANVCSVRPQPDHRSVRLQPDHVVASGFSRTMSWRPARAGPKSYCPAPRGPTLLLLKRHPIRNYLWTGVPIEGIQRLVDGGKAAQRAVGVERVQYSLEDRLQIGIGEPAIVSRRLQKEDVAQHRGERAQPTC